jgi:hypothetical protein
LLTKSHPSGKVKRMGKRGWVEFVLAIGGFLAFIAIVLTAARSHAPPIREPQALPSHCRAMLPSGQVFCFTKGQDE